MWISYPHVPMLDSLWSLFLASFEQEKKKNPIFVSLLKQLRPIELSEKKIVLHCDSHGLAFFLQKKIPFVEKSLSKQLGKKISVELVVLAKKKKVEPPLLRFEPTEDDIMRKARVSGRYRFDNFAVSPTNQVGYAAARAVSESLGKAYNPLFLWGGVGVGKTHLAQAIAHKALSDNKDKGVFFSPGDLFTNELIEAIREKTTIKFRRKYRGLDLLIIDDVQFIAGKNAIQEEFFHTFNAVISRGGQIILTADRPPREIKGLEDRLRSRFLGGLLVDIQPPDFELRSAILLIKAKEKNIAIDFDIAKVIAEQIVDTRSLEGTLLSLYAKTLGNGETINLDVVESFFKQKNNERKKHLSPADIIKTVCSYYNMGLSSLRGPTRAENIALPRQIAMYLLRKELGLTHEEIARLLRRKDHTTIIHGVSKIRSLLVRNPMVKQEVDRITNSFEL
ncbi:chromosomal replication initiator protein DnaA [Candidatus Roizmanbacteria bacterium]|nr:chromosomal replication initiator protein DnaA [Candidatus Roizmanbacteria bacterium]